ncbi:hypothetical protein BDP55DRAFT_38378 [Colletotrichum godetiae]|uniref:Uncharacterized protein n=1 Tax=Colletotrichum godetiae TaxID=1209918 RepID=A0AAJ0A643_9PEZI|nr:uncharacterized protein BDP55DRAFT_38378 [Colletotrichum godetiae]KAK1657155.1 hypothetical protein BDP55DRAFT_38378 [Colletotrichum godetiae]
MEVYHADDLAPVAEAQSPYCPARPVFVPISSAKRRVEDTPNKSGKRLRRAASAMALAEETVGNELYDDGNAKCDSRIVQDHKGWFIFKCEEHNLEIPYRAASVASSHLEIHAHDGPSAALSPITQALGVVPTEYDEANAELDDVERAPTTGYEALNSTTKHDALGSMQAVGDCDTSETIGNACPNDSSSPTGVRHASVTASDTTS